jgi:hypothetical protein
VGRNAGGGRTPSENADLLVAQHDASYLRSLSGQIDSTRASDAICKADLHRSMGFRGPVGVKGRLRGKC